MRQKQNRRVIFALAGAAAVALSVAVIGFAIMITKKTDAEKNQFTPAEINLNVVENGEASSGMTLMWEIPENESEAKVDKVVQIQNVNYEDENNADAFIRVALIPHWTRTAGTESLVVDVTNAANKDFCDFFQLTDVIKIDDENHSYAMNDDIYCQLYTGACADVTGTSSSEWSDYWIWNPKDGYFYYKYAVVPGEKTYPLLAGVKFANSEKLNSVYKGLTLQVDVLADAIQTEGGAVSSQWGENIGITVKTNDSGLKYLEISTTNTDVTAD